jgi:cyclophilin family peptidyl-prolyl cis-trans isomerase
MAKIEYALLTEVSGRWKADIIESYLRVEEIDVVLIEEAVSHLTHVTSFALVKIYVPKAGIRRARTLLKKFNEPQNNLKEKFSMANKKKIEERLAAERQARQARYIQIGSAALILVLIVAAFLVFSRKPQSPPPAATEAPTQSVSSTQAPSPTQSGGPTQAVEAGTQPACDIFSDIPAAAQYSAPPMKIDKTKQYFAAVKMAKGGEFVIQLYPDKAPITVNSFVFLACKGFFNNVTFHRVLDGFMAQGGDPTGTGTGGPGYEFVNEDSDLTFDKAGVVAMANAGRDTNGSQFFITFGPTAQLNGGYTIFGQVISGMDVVNAITRRDPQTNPSFTGDAMESVTITEK